MTQTACREAICGILGLVGRIRRSAKGGGPGLPISSFCEKDMNVFFGYYDLCPMNHDETILLATRVPVFKKGMPATGPMDVGFYRTREKERVFQKVGTTNTWCWQQGCRLQWYPLDELGKKQTILYNTMVGGNYGSVIQNLKTREFLRFYGRPIYAVTPDGRWGLSLNFSRLERLRPGYGYSNLKDPTKGILAPKEDGLWRVDIKSGKSTLLFPVADAACFHTLDSMAGAEHYFNHILSSPTGERFLFVHLWEGTEGRFGRLVTCDINGNNWCLLNNEGHSSHYTWKNSSHILAYATHKEIGTHFFEYEDLTGFRKMIGGRVLASDGHPSYSADKRWLLLDTYPDLYREQHVYLYDIVNDSISPLGNFHVPVFFQGDRRCDLHPRWSPSGHYVCVDAPLEAGRRGLCVFDVRSAT